MAHDHTHDSGHSHPVNMGLGDIIRRLMHIEWQGRHTGLTHEVRTERDMLLEALNVVPVIVGFDCNEDGVVDHGVGIFAQAASTSCCRLKKSADSSRYSPPEPEKKSVVESTSRAPVADEPEAPKKKGLFNLFGSKDET